jgi:hypothetical protein
MDFIKKIFTPFFSYHLDWYNTFFSIRIFPEPDPSTSLYTLDSKYYELTKNIRNYNILTHDEMKFINTLSRKQLLEIILIYDLHTQIIKPFILENM